VIIIRDDWCSVIVTTAMEMIAAIDAATPRITKFLSPRCFTSNW
jgi:hypothetical protein